VFIPKERLVLIAIVQSKWGESILAVSSALLPIRILAAVALVAVIAAFIYVLRHLKKIEQAIKADSLVPAGRGPRSNMVLIVCAIPVVVVTLLFFLIIKA
jgi:hypothetical protein